MRYMFLHPDLGCEDISKAKECFAQSFGDEQLKIVTMTKSELEELAVFFGSHYDSKEFWNKNNAYILDQRAYDNIFRPKIELPALFIRDPKNAV